MIDISAQYPMADIFVCSKLGMRPTESAAGAQNWGEKLFREIYLDKGSCTYYVITDRGGVSPNDYSIT